MKSDSIASGSNSRLMKSDSIVIGNRHELIAVR